MADITLDRLPDPDFTAQTSAGLLSESVILPPNPQSWGFPLPRCDRGLKRHDVPARSIPFRRQKSLWLTLGGWLRTMRAPCGGAWPSAARSWLRMGWGGVER
jgi:hypothetical protein